ncbi:MAG TPA: 4-hydroxybenzoate octaprenyltransferase [Rhodospirillaceae bacterium]|nr:4-hydroxybenzoate octaprenyltransferase [Rhodospirillaceae bacterium]
MSEHQTPRTDIPRQGWVDFILPSAAQPYARLMRLDRPIGIWLLLLPCWWSLSLASVGMPDPYVAGLFLLGAIVMRGAGCTYNDIVDRDIDAKVERTSTRPLPSGQISILAATVFLAGQLIIGLLVLLQFNALTIGLGISSLGLVAIYPFMKRITYWPQAWLGLTFNWGALMGWTAVYGTLNDTALLLYVGGFFWTIGYDAIYAHQDKEGDLLAGVKSVALALGTHTKPFVAFVYTISIALIAAANLIPFPFSYPTAILLGFAAIHLAWQVITLDINDHSNCLRRFKSNRDFGLLVLTAVLLIRF